MRKTLLILLSIFAALYTTGIVAGIAGYFAEQNFGDITFENLYIVFLFLLFIDGYVLSWRKEKLAGTILLSWLVLLWFGSGFIFSSSDGMALVLGLPVLPVAVLFLLLGYRKSFESKPEAYMEFRYCIRILSNLYLILYLIFAISEALREDSFSAFMYPDVLLFGLFLIFLLGYVYHTSKEHISGFIFIGWYVLLIIISALIPEIGGDGYLGLYAAIGSTILVQGVFYLYYWYRLRPEKD